MPAVSMPRAMTTMQQVVTQLRSPPQSAVPGMPTGAQVASSSQLQMTGSQLQGLRMQGIRVQGPPPQPGQQITRVRIQGSQSGQGQQIHVLGQGPQKAAAPGQVVTTASGQQLVAAQAEMQTSQQSGPAMTVQSQPTQAGPRPRGPPGYPGNQPPRFAAPGIMSACTIMSCKIPMTLNLLVERGCTEDA